MEDLRDKDKRKDGINHRDSKMGFRETKLISQTCKLCMYLHNVHAEL